MEDFKWSEYTQNMYYGRKSKGWSNFNLKRVFLLKKILKKFLEGEKTLEIGSFDLYSQKVFKKVMRTQKKIVALDYYKDEIFALAKHNIQILNSKNQKYSLKNQNAENLEVNEKFDNIFAFETLEHIKNEKKAIENICRHVKDNGKIFISFPTEWGLMFLIKSLARKIILNNDKNSFKELFWGLFGKTNKIKNIKGAHKGYDFRETFRLIEKEGFKLKYKKFYPFNLAFFSYGGVAVFEKINSKK